MLHMYTQFFGNYLFSNGYITKDQLLSVLVRQNKTQVRVGTLALYTGYMSAPEIRHVEDLQKEEESNFSEIAIRDGYLTQSQVVELLHMKSPDFLILGQILIDDGVFSYEEFENILADYRSNSEFFDMELNDETKKDYLDVVEIFSIISESAIPNFGKYYLELLFNNLIRYIGDDFSSLPPSICSEFPADCCVSQSINGDYKINMYFSTDEAAAMELANRYSGEDFEEYNEYVSAAVEDLLNIHNGLFIVNASNNHSNELSIGNIKHHNDMILTFENQAYLFPICYSFGIIYFIMEIVSL